MTGQRKTQRELKLGPNRAEQLRQVFPFQAPSDWPARREEICSILTSANFFFIGKQEKKQGAFFFEKKIDIEPRR